MSVCPVVAQESRCLANPHSSFGFRMKISSALLLVGDILERCALHATEFGMEGKPGLQGDRNGSFVPQDESCAKHAAA